MRNTNHEKQENQAKQGATEQRKLRELESHKYQRLEEARESEPECWSKKICQLSSPVSTKSCGSDLNNWYLARGSCCA